MPLHASTTVKRSLFGLLLALLIVPPLQAKFQWLEESPLYGAFEESPHPKLVTEDLFDNSYQTRLERYLEDRIGFRRSLIRLRNQLSFSLFRVVRLSDLVVGTDGVLYQPGAIDAYLGKDYMGDEEVAYRVRRLRAVQQDLAARNVQLLFVLAPNKASFEPEHFPLSLRFTQPAAKTNYSEYSAAMKQAGINLLDARQLMAAWKDTARYPLFPNGGTHWSGYAATLIADTLFRRLEHMGRLDLPDYADVAKPQIRHHKLRGNDSDLSDPLNLMQEYPGWAAYRQLAFQPAKPGQERPNTLVVGDSFTWGLMLFAPYMQNLLAPETRIWYYNTTTHIPESTYHPDPDQLRPNLDLRKEVESRKFIVIVSTDYNLKSGEFGFTNQVYNLYHPFTPADEARIKEIEEELHKNLSWEESAKEDPGALQARLHEQAVATYDKQR